mmetsp:Transcript_27034/g.40915  ORF Transcript_27034/g.40915 Transcript_27034/m.40915 type:complete len:294 (+) Transcript_27034:67-948(+)
MCRVTRESESDSNSDTWKKSKNPSSHKKKNGRKSRTRKSQSPVPSANLPPKHRYIAMDCEMVGIGPHGETSSPACVTIIDWDGRVIFHAYIRQTEPVTDYRTHVSGITESILQKAKLSLEECRAIVSQHLYNRILVGHALKNDLTALRISHPWWLTRDTAEYEPFMQWRRSSFDGREGLWPRKLRDLALHELGQRIQKSGEPHSSWEDAFAALKLYRKVRNQWEAKVVEDTKKQMDYEYKRLRHEQEMFFIQPHIVQQQYQRQAHEQQMFFMQQQQEQMLLHQMQYRRTQSVQ